MTKFIHPRKAARRFALFLGILALCALPASAQSELTSEWSIALGTKSRLIAGTTDQGLTAGIQIVLEDGWKTYWRNPGAGGIPPIFDWSGSDNIAEAKTSLPAPRRHVDSYGTSMGYKHAVIFPVSVTVRDPGQPATLRLKMDYAVCEKLCVPVEANFELPIPSNVTLPYSSGLQDIVDTLPKPADSGDASIEQVELAGTADKPVMVFSVRVAGNPVSFDAFVEGPSDWFVPAPVQVNKNTDGEETVLQYSVGLDGAAPGATISGTPFRVTIVTREKAVERDIILP